MAGFEPRYLILHDYGKMPEGDVAFNPYHALIARGQKKYRYPANPYGASAPHAYQLNPYAIGLSWGGPVGGMPDQKDLDLLRAEYRAIKEKYPNIQVLSHGEAFARRGEIPRASKLGRGLEEASWRKLLETDAPAPVGATPAAVPVSQRSLTAYAGYAAPPAKSSTPMPTYKDVASPPMAQPTAPVMSPESVASARAMARMLMNQGQDTGNITHWTQALGKALQSGVGAMWQDRALSGEREGMSAGNAALADMLAGGDGRAALVNPYSAKQALEMQMQERNSALDQRRQLELLRERERLQQSDPMRQLDMQLKRAELNNSSKFDERMKVLAEIGIPPASAEGQTFLANGRLPAAAYQQMNQRQLKMQSGPKIAEGLQNLNKMTVDIDDASFGNALGPIQGSTPDGLLTAPFANIARAYGEVANMVQGGNRTPNEVRNNINGATEALAAAIKPLIRAPGEGVWTDADQARLVAIVGDLAQASTKPEFKRRLNAVRDRIRDNFGLEIPFDAMAGQSPSPAPDQPAAAANDDGWTEVAPGIRVREKR